MEKILISACLLGENVRYNAQIKAFQSIILQQWHQENRLIMVCPEVAGGLSTPRHAAEIKHQRVITTTGKDVTSAFQLGAQKALKLCQAHHIKYALLKESSPSCGSNTIYDGHFTAQKISGMGITTALLRDHGITVYSENEISILANKLLST